MSIATKRAEITILPAHKYKYIYLQNQRRDFSFSTDQIYSLEAEFKMADLPIQQNMHLALGTFVTPGPHPSQGGNLYLIDMWHVVIALWQNGDDLQSPMLNCCQEMRVFPHIATCQTWIPQYMQVGHVDPKKATGNHCASCKIRGKNIVQLAIYLATNPKATTDEICDYLFNLQNPDHQLPSFSSSQVLQTELIFGLTDKVGSTICHCAHLPINLAKQDVYFNMAKPFGISNTPISNVIIINEAGIKLEHDA